VAIDPRDLGIEIVRGILDMVPFDRGVCKAKADLVQNGTLLSSSL